MYHIGMVRVYRYRLYPSRAQHVVMLGIIDAWQAAHNAEPTKTVVDAATGKLEVKP